MAGDQKYDIVFRGKLVRDFAEADVLKNLARIFKTDEDRLGELFSGERKVLKRGLDRPTADKYRATLKQAGAVVAVVSAERREQASRQSEPARAEAQGETAAPDSGSKPASEGKASFQIDETPPDPDPEPESEAGKPREIRAAYEGKASFQIDETPPEPEPEPEADTPREVKAAYEGKASFQIDEPDDAPTDGEKAGAPPPPEDHGGDLEFESVSISAADPASEPSASQPAEADGGLDFEPATAPAGEMSASLADPGEQIVEPESVEAPKIETGELSVESDYDALDTGERASAPEIDVGDLSTDEDFDVLDGSERPTPPEIPIGDLDVAEVGATVDESERPAAREIDTGDLSMDDDFDSLDTPEKPKPPEIDISGLSLEDDPD